MSPATKPVRIVVIGAGAIGRKHLSILESQPIFTVPAISDPNPEAASYAKEHDIRHFIDFEKMLDEEKPDGVIVATPNQFHLPAGLACIARKIPLLIEKPVADTIESALTLVRAAEKAKVPVLVGHHRRHNPIIRKAAQIVRDGELGRVTAINAVWFTRKPDDYFNVSWRREAGGGPVLINAIHDIDCLRMICGEIESVQAMVGHEARGLKVEDTAAALLRFTSGAIGTLIVSDAVPSSWNWDVTSRENTVVPHQSGTCYVIAGTKASLSIPNLKLSWDEKRGGWSEALTHRYVAVVPADPYVEQLRHFARVIRGEEQPVIDVAEGTRTLATTLAIARSAMSGKAVRVDDLMQQH